MVGQNVYNRISEQTAWVGDESREMVDHYPISTALVAFGLGVGAGIALVSLLTEDSYQQKSTTYATKLGKQMLEAMSSVVPNSVSKSLGMS